MKTTILAISISIILIVSVIGSIFYFQSLVDPSQSAPSDEVPNTSYQLEINNLLVLADGKVSFDVTLNEDESEVIETIIVNGESYSWIDGSQEDSTISKNQTKQWIVDIGTLEQNENIQVIVEATTGSVSANATVGASTPNGSTSTDPIVDPQVPNNQTLPDYIYDYYGGVNLFSEGIHIFATSEDPRTLFGEYEFFDDFWRMLLETETNQATDQDFISILLSRGDKPTGGYKIQIENFAWLESFPVKFLFQINFTDPGEDVIVTQTISNPLVLVSIGKLTPGEYNIEVPIAQYVFNFDKEGNPIYDQILTFAPVFWEQKLIVIDTDAPTSTTFKVILNGNEAPDLTVQVNLSNGLTEEEAKRIVEVAFIQTLGEKLHRLDRINYNDEQIAAHYIWGYDENDMGHIFDLNADLTNLKLKIDHCR